MFDHLKARAVALLRAAERYTKVDMVYLASGSFWSLAGQVAASGTALVLSVAMARYVPKDVYGTYKYILAIIDILMLFSLGGIGTAVMQSTARGYGGALVEGLEANLRWSFAVFIGALAFGAYYLLAGNAVLGVGILLGGCAAPLIASFNLYAPYLAGKKEFRLQVWYMDVVTNIVPAAALIAVAYLAPQPLLLILTYVVANLAATAYAYLRTRQRFRAAEGARDPHMLTYGKHLSVIGIVSGIAGNLDQLLLFHFVGAASLAIYAFSIGIVDQSKGPLKMIDTMMQARFAPQSETSIARGMMQKCLLLALGGLVMCAIYIPLAPFIYRVLFPAYLVAVPYSQVYCLSLLSLGFAPAVSYLTAKKKIRLQYQLSLIGAVIKMIAIVIGVIWYGLWGLIVAIVLVRFINSGLPFLLYRRSPMTE